MNDTTHTMSEAQTANNDPVAVPGRNVLSRLRRHLFVIVLIGGALVGGGLRFSASDTAAAVPAGGGAGASTACAAQ